MLCALCVGQASALEYTMEAPDDYLFGRPTSDDTIYEWEDPNVDRSKNNALIPPGFGTPTSYLPGSGNPLTPNLIHGALDGGGLVSQTGSVNYPVIDTGNGGSSGQDVGYTAVTSDLYYSGGHLGTLKIPAIGLSTKVYEGTDSSTLAKGAGHFPGTSIWDGNCCIAGHNRGVRDDFGDLHTLEPGDTITAVPRPRWWGLSCWRDMNCCFAATQAEMALPPSSPRKGSMYMAYFGGSHRAVSGLSISMRDIPTYTKKSLLLCGIMRGGS